METSESSDEEWVFSSSNKKNNQQKQLKKKEELANALPIKKLQKLTISEASIRTIRANIPKSNRLPPFQPHINNNNNKKPIVKQFTSSPPPLTTTIATTTTTTTNLLEESSEPSLQFISDEEISIMCKGMNAKLLVFRVIQVYKSTEVFLRIRDIETDTLSIESRLLSFLHLASNPTEFIINTLFSLAKYFGDNNKNKYLTPKFRKLLAHTFCTALSRFYQTPITVQYEQEKSLTEPDLISFEDDFPLTTKEEEEINLISFEELPALPTPIIEEEEFESEEEEDSEEEEEILDFIPLEPIKKYTLCQEDQLKILSFIDIIASPVVIYYAIDVFRLVQLISFARDYEEYGVKLCKLLMKHGYFDEYINCVKKLKLQPFFPTEIVANHLFNGGSGTSLLPLVQGQPVLQKEVLSFINQQLKFYYAGNLGIVPVEYLSDLVNNSQPQLSKLKDKHFKKDLISCANKIMKSLNAQKEDYYFIHLTQRYACLRYLLIKRSQQQAEEDNYSIESSSNYNGLIDILCQSSPELAKLCIKELIDMGDVQAAPYFASQYKQQEFYCRYNNLPSAHRTLGLVKIDETIRKSYTPLPTLKPAYYQLPSHINYMMIDSYTTLMYMKDVLSASNICGIDTEWVPAFAKSDDIKTALMQISSDISSTVYLLDLKTILMPGHAHLLRLTEKILQLFFEDNHLLKLAYDFSGDMDLLHTSIPSSKTWKIQRLLDYKSVRTMPDKVNKHGQPITGGLSGLACHFLGVCMNKKQQISNWERRPLTKEQMIYGACDAYCLLDIYTVLVKMQHPFIIDFNNSNPYF